jgi:hypothetical protein
VTRVSRSYWIPSDAKHYRLKASLRSACLQGLLEVNPARLFVAMLARRSGCLYTLFDQDHDSVFFSSWSIKPAMLSASMLGDYSTSASSTPSWFSHHTDLLENLSLITSLLDLFFLLFPFWIIIPAFLPATMLGYYSMSASLMPSEIFSSSFRSIGSLLPIGCHSTSLRSARLQTGRLLSRFVLFFFWTDVHAIRPVDSSTTSP